MHYLLSIRFAHPKARLFGLALITLCVTAGFTARPVEAQLQAHISTSRGCLETGQNAVFAIGEYQTAFITMSSDTFEEANATLYILRNTGFISVIGFGTLPTNVTFGIAAHVGPAVGLHQLRLKASTSGVSDIDTCTFRVVSGSITQTPLATRTPTPTRTVTRTRTPSATPNLTPPAAALEPHIRTDRGCDQTGDNPVYFVGEPITVHFDIGSDTLNFANATVFDILPNGFSNALSFGTLATNQTYVFHATNAPPTGTETLRLRASAFGYASVSSDCSFTVAYAPTRTRTPTRTGTPTRTATATATATPDEP
jgi:hypothetical protein